MELYPPVGQDVLDLISQANHIIIAGHKKPDGDCIYSCMALDRIFASMGKKTVMVNEGPFNKSEVAPCASSFLPSVPDAFWAERPLVVIVDCSDLQRVGSALDPEKCKGLKTVVLDHHSSHDSNFGDSVYRVPDSISTTLIVYKLAEALGVSLSKECAQYIFRGFITDSGCFKFLDSKQNESYKIISALMNEHCICTSYEYEYLYNRESMAVNRFLSKLMDRCQLFYDGRLAISFETEQDASDFPGISAPTDDLYARMFLVQGVEAVVMVNFVEPLRTNLGFRSSHRSGIDVGSIAASMPGKFNGGGHFHASGADVAFSIDDTLKQLLDVFKPVFESKS